MKRYVFAAAEDNSKLQDTISDLKDDFDYIISGLDKLERSGAEASNAALIIAEGVSKQFQTYVSEIADKLSE